jgi:hypothetical protein
LVAKIRLTGAQLKAALAGHLSHDAHGLVALSGVRLSTRCRKSELEVTLRRNDGRLVADRDQLLIVTSDYLATGGDSLFSSLNLTPAQIEIETGSFFRDALASALVRHPRLSPEDPAIFDPAHPRLSLPTPRPVRCPN